jgi:hypothetical protein
MGPPDNWSEAMVENNRFRRYGRTITQFTKQDPTSMMMYSFRKSSRKEQKGVMPKCYIITTVIRDDPWGLV